VEWALHPSCISVISRGLGDNCRCRLAVGLDFTLSKSLREVRVIVPDAPMHVDVRKEREGVSKNRSSESVKFYRFSSVCTKTAVRMCNESET
jgi:hypothetical protein